MRAGPRLIVVTAITAAGAWLAAPGAAPAASTIPTAAQIATTTCQGERASHGKKSFRRHYGKRPMRACLRRNTADARDEIEWTGEACADDLAEFGPEQFGLFYGNLPDGSDAWTNCVLEGLGLVDLDESDTAVVDDGTLDTTS
jgi:hypothetical protein